MWPSCRSPRFRRHDGCGRRLDRRARRAAPRRRGAAEAPTTADRHRVRPGQPGVRSATPRSLRDGSSLACSAPAGTRSTGPPLSSSAASSWPAGTQRESSSNGRSGRPAWARSRNRRREGDDLRRRIPARRHVARVHEEPWRRNRDGAVAMTLPNHARRVPPQRGRGSANENPLSLAQAANEAESRQVVCERPARRLLGLRGLQLLA
jgi:hypothetical protein